MERSVGFPTAPCMTLGKISYSILYHTLAKRCPLKPRLPKPRGEEQTAEDGSDSGEDENESDSGGESDAE